MKKVITGLSLLVLLSCQRNPQSNEEIKAKRDKAIGLNIMQRGTRGNSKVF